MIRFSNKNVASTSEVVFVELVHLRFKPTQRIIIVAFSFLVYNEIGIFFVNGEYAEETPAGSAGEEDDARVNKRSR